MSDYKFFLDSNKSIEGTFSTETKTVSLSFKKLTPKNNRNIENLTRNLQNIISVSKKNNILTISVRDVPFVQIDETTQMVTNLHGLTAFETRLLARSDRVDSLPFERFEQRPMRLTTNLHTHISAALTPEKLIEIGTNRGIIYSEKLAKDIGLDVSGLKITENGTDKGYLLDDLIQNPKNYDLLVAAMKIDTSSQVTFNKMEEIYDARKPFTKNNDLFVPSLFAIAQDCQANGVKYIELSSTTILKKEPGLTQIKEMETYLPQIEAQYGVRIRFLGAISRLSHKEKIDDDTRRLEVVSRSPYIVGCDFMGHETNPTSDFGENLKRLAIFAMRDNPGFVIRVHAGENSLYQSNLRQVLTCIEEAHQELLQQTGKNFPYPQVRIGHGIYGFDQPAVEDESEVTRELSTESLFKKVNPIIEYNMSSNLALNNINTISTIPLKPCLEKGYRCVLGTDGRGIYLTNTAQEMILAHEAGATARDFEKIAKTESEVIAIDSRRFAYKSARVDSKASSIAEEYDKIPITYTEEIQQAYKTEIENSHKLLETMIKESGAITDRAQIDSAIAGKKPILITGSSYKHFKDLEKYPEQLRKIKVCIEALVRTIDPDKAYIVTGGTNHGVEKIMHEAVFKYNQTHTKKIVLLGTLTEEAAVNNRSFDPKVRETNKIEKNTITHALIPRTKNGIARRWNDLPEAVLDEIGEQDGEVIAMSGGIIVSDMIQRAHNLGLDLNIMSGVIGASGIKAKALQGNGYDFKDARELILKLSARKPELFRISDPAELDKLITELYMADIGESKSRRGNIITVPASSDATLPKRQKGETSKTPEENSPKK